MKIKKKEAFELAQMAAKMAVKKTCNHSPEFMWGMAKEHLRKAYGL